MDKIITKRQSKNKKLLLELLRKTPIIQIACERSGVSRASYYRWKEEDVAFAKNSDQAISEGKLLVNDMAESQLMSAIKDKNMTAIIFWLKHHHPTYSSKIEILSNNNDNLTNDDINKLIQLLYNKNTFKDGQELLTSYVIKGYISEKLAQLILRMFLSQLRVEDMFIKKSEIEIMAEVMMRKIKQKEN